jgi:2-methylcitrate dehydratase PrpD
VCACAERAAADPALAALDDALAPLLPRDGAPSWAAYRLALAAALGAWQGTAHDERQLVRTVVVAAALAAGPQASPPQLAAAVARGCELTLRLEGALGAGQRERGWSRAGANGAIGAAVAAGRLLGCSPDQLGHAIGLAATQAAGFERVLADREGGAQLAGKTAFNGVEAALLARAGVTAAPAAVAGRRGLLALTAPDAAPEPLTDALGERWVAVAGA